MSGMEIGISREMQNNEFRVAITSAGAGSSRCDAGYAAAGGKIRGSAVPAEYHRIPDLPVVEALG